MGDANAARLTNRLAEDEIITDRFPQRQILLIQPVQNVQTEQLVRGVDAGRFEGLDFEQYAQQEDMRTATTLLSLLDNLISLAVDPPSLYLDLEGVKLGRHGSISIFSLYVLPRKKIYLIDIHRLGKTASSTTNSSATSLKTILESPTIPKVIFDICNDSDALFSHYEISVDGIKDLQLMELATRKGSKDFVAGLAKCIEKDSPVSTAAKAEWQRTKEGASRLYDPKKGGRYEIFNERPMRSEIVQYCTRDVALLPGLYNVNDAKLRLPGENFWQVQVREATKDRIKLSQVQVMMDRQRLKSVDLGIRSLSSRPLMIGMTMLCLIH